MIDVSFDKFFEALSGGHTRHDWQRDLAGCARCENRLIRVPTGMGKTLGVLGVWCWYRVVQADPSWPRRLVWCLPMRVLVEQTAWEVRQALLRVRQSFPELGPVGVHELMGGADSGDWHLYPERDAVLVGTQDMLLSRALNRGYGCPRARWPMDFGLLSHDCLWVLDEVQLMDVGLATSGQLQVFRDEDAQKEQKGRPCRSWWMSATLQESWLRKSPDTEVLAGKLETTSVPPAQRVGELWERVEKPCECQPLTSVQALADLVVEKHVATGRGAAGPTLVVVNRVETATQLFTRLQSRSDLSGCDRRLMHSRFRPFERRAWRDEFLNRAGCAPGTDRIIVATQVIEAGVDISAGLLISALGPWPSLVQRFGRCARWGGEAKVVIADFSPKDDRQAAPYELTALQAARAALSQLRDVSPRSLEAFEEAQSPETRANLYPYEPKHLLLRHEIDELFDTTPDLSGADIDISRFIRSGEERDLQVFWEAIDKDDEPDPTLRASRDALCAVPFGKARDWLCGTETKDKKAPSLKPNKDAWVWDWQDRQWRRAQRSDLYPGQIVLVAARCGGYDPATGWNPDAGEVEPVEAPATAYRTKTCWKRNTKNGEIEITERRVRDWAAEELADASEDDEALSAIPQWQTIASHGLQVGGIAQQIAQDLAPKLATLLELAGRWHDAGKAHPAFQVGMQAPDRPAARDLAKAPESAWPCSAKQLYRISDQDRRPGFRHELASTLALFDLLRRHRPNHPALLGPWVDLLTKAGREPDLRVANPQTASELEQEIVDLAPHDFDLLAYLVCTHHGKVRMAWHASPADQKANDEQPRIRGVRDGEILPALRLATRSGHIVELPASRLDLAPAAAGLNPITGMGWTERVLGLLKRHGPFQLAWLEALLRAADIRASQTPLADPLLTPQDRAHDLDRSHPTLAGATSAGEAASAMAEHSAERGGEHGFRRRAGVAGDAQSGTRPPDAATRFLDTALGRLSYTELAPHLARAAQRVEARILAGHYDTPTLDETLLLCLHTDLCGELVPAMTGWRRTDVRVGAHEPPPFTQVPMLMREYALDLAARLAAAPESPPERFLETLAFAEGRLLSIHPFADFNGRVTRLFLRWLLRRLDLPVVALVPEPGAETERYLAALRAGDTHDGRPLMEVWRSRFETANPIPTEPST